MSSPAFTAIVLAGDRRPDEPLAQAAQTPCKVLAPVADTPMVVRTLQTVQSCASIDQVILVGPQWRHVQSSQELMSVIESDNISWQEPQQGPSRSAQTAASSISASKPVTIITADHGLLESHMLKYFLDQAQQSDKDVVVALVGYDEIAQKFPGIKKTVLKFSDRHYCGANLFGLMTTRGRIAVDHWVKLETRRKNPTQLVRFIGWSTMLRYLFKRLTLAEALELLSRKMGIRIGAVVLPYPEAAIDVDSVADWEMVKTIVESEASRQ